MPIELQRTYTISNPDIARLRRTTMKTLIYARNHDFIHEYLNLTRSKDYQSEDYYVKEVH